MVRDGKLPCTMENSPVQGPDGKMHVNKCAMCQSILYVRGLTNLPALLGPWASKRFLLV